MPNTPDDMEHTRRLGEWRGRKTCSHQGIYRAGDGNRTRAGSLGSYRTKRCDLRLWARLCAFVRPTSDKGSRKQANSEINYRTSCLDLRRCSANLLRTIANSEVLRGPARSQAAPCRIRRDGAGRACWTDIAPVKYDVKRDRVVGTIASTGGRESSRVGERSS